MTRPAELARLRAAGFDSFHSYATDPVLETALALEARRQGMRMVIYPDNLRQGPGAVVAGWPLDAWYLMDEPDVQGASSSTMRGLSARTRAWDPATPQTFVVGIGTAAARYADIADILMLDWYPVPHLATDSVADQIDAARSVLPPGKPLWMVVQAYDWADEIVDPVKRARLRFPTGQEIRFMSYLSVLHGASGLFYFTLAKKGGTLFDHPELWGAVTKVAQEMRVMRPIWERGERVGSAVPPGTRGLEVGVWRYHCRDHAVLANRGAEAVAPPSEFRGNGYRPMFDPPSPEIAADTAMVLRGPLDWGCLLGLRR